MTDSEEDIPKEIPFSPVGMQEFQLKFNDSMPLSLLQAPTAFCASGAGDTGLLLLGACVALGQYLVHYHAEIIQDKKVMELWGVGCFSISGCVPSRCITGPIY
jgi:hypothetical protein